MIYKDIVELLGNTPVMEYDDIYIKLEYYNPTGSIKDRAALYMIDEALKKGVLKKGDTIVEPTSGNTGIGLAAFGSLRGLKVVIIMPESMSIERIKAIKAYGAEIVLTKASEGMNGAVCLAQKLVKDQGYIMLDQFSNSDNALAHEKTTALEIIKDFPQLDAIVCGIGTGGTITGLARTLKAHYHNIKIYGVEPYESPLITKGEAGKHAIQGIGANFIPSLLDLSLVDKVLTVKGEDALNEMKELAKKGLFLGISSAASVVAAKMIYKKGEKILAIAPDGGLKYLSVIE